MKYFKEIKNPTGEGGVRLSTYFVRGIQTFPCLPSTLSRIERESGEKFW